MNKLTKFSTLHVRTVNGRHKLIRFMDIVMIESNGNGIKMMVKGIIYTHWSTLDEFMYNTLGLRLFCRVHKKYIANCHKIDTWDDSTHELFMMEGSNINFSDDGLKAYKTMLKPQLFKKIIQLKIDLKFETIVPVIKKIIVPVVKKQ